MTKEEVASLKKGDKIYHRFAGNAYSHEVIMGVLEDYVLVRYNYSNIVPKVQMRDDIEKYYEIVRENK